MGKEPSKDSGKIKFKIKRVIKMHRYTNQEGINLIKHYEGFSANTYICPAGYETIGYGHKLLEQEKYRTISRSDAENLLSHDLYKSEIAVIKLIDVPLSDNQFSSLVSFVFNLGSGALQRSTLRQKINYGLHKEIEKEFMRWVYAGGKKLPGLIARRRKESILFLG